MPLLSKSKRFGLQRAGYTLLEVMVAMAILAFALTAIMGTQSTAVMMSGYANKLSVVTLLARSKMIDVEHEVMSGEIGSMDEVSINGDFGEDGYPQMKWDALVERVEISEGAESMFVGTVLDELFGEGSQLTGNPAISGTLQQIISFLPDIINMVGERIRKVTLVIMWDMLGREQTMTVTQYVVISEAELNPDGTLKN